MTRVRALALAAGVVLSVGHGTSRAQRREVIERVVAVVGDEAIFLSELRRRAVPFLPQAMSAGTEVERMARLEQLYRQLLDALIDEQLFEQAAQQMQLRVTTEDVDQAIRNVQRQSQLGDNEFWNAVRQQGFTEAQYRADVRRQLLRLKVLNNRARGRVNITEEDVQARYRQLARERGGGDCFDTSILVVQVPPSATASEVAAKRGEAEALRARVTPDSFAAAGGIDIGRICEGDLHESLTGALAGMQAGQISQPIRGPNGFYLLHLRARAESAVAPYAQLRQQIFQQLMERAMQEQERLLVEELRRQAVIDDRL